MPTTMLTAGMSQTDQPVPVGSILDVLSGGLSVGTQIAGSEVLLAGGAPIVFAGGALVVDGDPPTAVISGFSAGNTIDLTGLPTPAAATRCQPPVAPQRSPRTARR